MTPRPNRYPEIINREIRLIDIFYFVFSYFFAKLYFSWLPIDKQRLNRWINRGYNYREIHRCEWLTKYNASGPAEMIDNIMFVCYHAVLKGSRPKKLTFLADMSVKALRVFFIFFIGCLHKKYQYSSVHVWILLSFNWFIRILAKKMGLLVQNFRGKEKNWLYPFPVILRQRKVKGAIK